jgi:hypothetical protein
LQQGVPPRDILVLLPQRTLAWPYYEALRGTAGGSAAGRVRVATIAGLARELIARFWPQIAGPAGFVPERLPQFLTFETAQYVLDHVAAPAIAAGAFEGVAVARPRLLAQILDNLDRLAANDLPLDELAARLKAAWSGDTARARVYDQVQALAAEYRQVCLNNSLLDWSLQVEVLLHHVLALPEARETLLGGYRHLIVDNSEENPPVVHDLMRQWLPVCESALVVHDTGGGYRLLLGADPAGSLALAPLCRRHETLPDSTVPAPGVAVLGAELEAALGQAPRGRRRRSPRHMLPAVRFESRRLYPEMLGWAAEQVSRLVMEEGVPPDEIAVLLPFVSDSAQFALAERLAPFGISLRVHRPGRALSGDPNVRALLTWARLAHPDWHRPPSADETARALVLSVADMDPVRARLLVDIVYRVRDASPRSGAGRPALTSFEQIVPATQERIGRLLGGRYDEVWRWLEAYRAGGPLPLEQFVRRLVDELLAQPGFGFTPGSAAAASAATLVESIEKFSATLSPLQPAGPAALGAEYVSMVERGIVAGQYLSSWEPGARPGVLVASPLTFVLMNRPVRVQLWLDVGSRAWFERVYQPLSQPYVLSRAWSFSPPGGPGRLWTDEDEVRVRRESLAQLVLGLAYRCRERVYLAYSELNEQGYEQRGALLQAIVTVLNRAAASKGKDVA